MNINGKFKLLAVKRVGNEWITVAEKISKTRDKESFRKELIKKGVDFDGIQSINIISL